MGEPVRPTVCAQALPSFHLAAVARRRVGKPCAGFGPVGLGLGYHRDFSIQP